MSKINSTDKTLKKWVRVLIKCMIIVFFSIGIYLIISSLNLNAPIEKVLLSYNIEQAPEYKVNVIDNNYINEESLSSTNRYITNIIESIDLNFNYIYEATKKGSYDYKYNIKATIYGEYHGNVENNDTKLWTKDYILIDETKKRLNDVNTISLNEEVKLDFQKYNNEVLNFKNDLNVPINAYLEVVMDIDINGIADGNKIKDNKKQKFVIPLNQIAFSITKETKINDYKEITHTEDNREINSMKFNAGIFMTVFSVSLLTMTFKLIFKKKSKFDSELDRILKSYSDIIVELASSISIEGKEIVLVKAFSEMLDLEEELRIPINFIQTERNEGKFFIVNNDICYMWVLEEEKEEVLN